MNNPEQQPLTDAAADIERLREAVAEAERRLREENYTNTALTRTILHDLKNPLTVTLGNLQVIRILEHEKFSERTTRLLEAAEESCKTQLAIISNFSDLLKMDMNALSFELTPFDPAPLIASQVASFTRLDPSKTYSFSPPSSSFEIMAEAEHFSRIVRNLLGNSMRHTRSGGVIKAVLGEPDKQAGAASLQIQDMGEPIPTEALDRIFDRRSHTLSDSPGRRGDVGMGLAYSHAAARAMNGKLVALESRVGALFELTFPLART